ncbi:transposase [bacterium]|nr:transposase [bacterium]
MIRPRRIVVKNGVYHFYNRFINGEAFFQDIEIVRVFVKYLYEAANYFNVDIIFWMCMQNHFHIILRINNENLSEFIQRYATKFARYINKKFNRKGPVFESRHKTKLIDTDEYFMTVLGYIILNPIKSGIVNDIFKYKWSNLDEIINENDNKNYSIIYDYFSKDREVGRKFFKKWVRDLVNDKVKLENIEKFHGQFLMNKIKKEEILKNINRRQNRKKVDLEKRANYYQTKKVSYEEIKNIIAKASIKNEYWKGIWKTKSKFVLHLKWYLLRYFCNFTLNKIRIIERAKKHSTISSALERIKRSSKKITAINSFIKENIAKKDIK